MRAASAPVAAPPSVTPFRVLKHAGVHSLAISRDGQLLASAATTDFPGPGEVRLWRMRDGRLLRVTKYQYGVYSVAFSPDSRTLAITSNGTVALWDVRSWRRTDGDGLALGDDRREALLQAIAAADADRLLAIVAHGDFELVPYVEDK